MTQNTQNKARSDLRKLTVHDRQSDKQMFTLRSLEWGSLMLAPMNTQREGYRGRS